MSFGNKDYKEKQKPHEDALITVLVTNYITQRILIDNKSSSDILLHDAIIKMRIDPN